MRSGSLMMSLLASKIFRHSFASPYMCLAIFERLSPFWTVYVLDVDAPVGGGIGFARDGAVDELPLSTFEKSGCLSLLESRSMDPMEDASNNGLGRMAGE